MKGFGFILCLLALLACSDKQGTPTSTTSPNNGITRIFEIALTPGDCPNSPCLDSTTADTYCVSVGFEYSTDSRFLSEPRTTRHNYIVELPVTNNDTGLFLAALLSNVNCQTYPLPITSFP